jgi:hypothetical protein
MGHLGGATQAGDRSIAEANWVRWGRKAEAGAEQSQPDGEWGEQLVEKEADKAYSGVDRSALHLRGGSLQQVLWFRGVAAPAHETEA